jgi:hypothetical protein
MLGIFEQVHAWETCRKNFAQFNPIWVGDWGSRCKLAFTGRNVLMALKIRRDIKKNLKFQALHLLWPRSIHLCHQKPNPARETVPLSSDNSLELKMTVFPRYRTLVPVPYPNKRKYATLLSPGYITINAASVLQRDVVYLGWTIAPSYISPNAEGGGSRGVSANEYSSTQEPK